MKRSNSKKRIPIYVFDCDVLVVFTKNVQEYLRKSKDFLFKKEIIDDWNAICFYNNFNNFNNIYIILPNNASTSLICHEVSHAVDLIMDYRGLKDGETKACIFEYLIKNIIPK